MTKDIFFSIESLKCFIMVAQYQSLSVAAKKLNKTSPAISMMLKQFQEAVERPLFETSRKAVLTEFGKFVYLQASEELNNLEKLSSLILSYSRSEFGFLSLAMVPSISNYILSNVINGFLETSPNVQLDISDSDSKTILRDVEKNRIDVGICSTYGDLSEALFSNLLLEDSFGIVCKKDHPILKNKKRISWEAIKPYPIVNNEVCNKIDDPHFQKIINHSQIMARNTRTILSLIHKSERLTVLPYLTYHFTHENLEFIPLNNFYHRASMNTPARKLQIVVHKNSVGKLMIQKLIKLVHAELNSNSLIKDSPFVKCHC